MLMLTASLAIWGAQAQESPSWIRHSAISPDGKTLAFSYKGDIFTVSASGGEARQLTSNRAYESDPIWTPDGQFIVFSSTREDSKDIFVSPREGGQPRRLTTLPGGETPLAVTADGQVYFSWSDSSLQVPDFDGFPGYPGVYRTDLQGREPELVTPLTLAAMSFNAAGDLLYEDWKGYEDPLRKHHTSSVTRDIWLYKPARTGVIDAQGSFRKLSTYEGEDRNPVFAADGDSFYFLSERDGKTSNIYRSSLRCIRNRSRNTCLQNGK